MPIDQVRSAGAPIGSALFARAMGGDTQHPGHDAVATFDHTIEDQSSIDERHQELGERNVSSTDTRPDARTELRRGVIPDRLAIAGHQSETLVTLGHGIDVLADEARMHPEMYETATRGEHTADLMHHSIEVVNVGVDEGHPQHVGAGRSEGQMMRVCAHDAVATLPGERQLVYGEVNSDNAPASRLNGLRC